ncbi:hypothetical protein ACQPXB_28025 [Amycolatopsis sp. CA-161197]|uniref:hypothetical protein n=1 Tax=Amycolatopsis sp. CA-161197 TaxID=3239922 RepID=UPI003D8ACDFB
MSRPLTVASPMLNPMIAGTAAMEFSPVFLVSHSLWLRRFHSPLNTAQTASPGAPESYNRRYVSSACAGVRRWRSSP